MTSDEIHRYCDVVAVAINNCQRHIDRTAFEASASSSSSTSGTSHGAQTPNPGRVAPRHPEVDAAAAAASGDEAAADSDDDKIVERMTVLHHLIYKAVFNCHTSKIKTLNPYIYKAVFRQGQALHVNKRDVTGSNVTPSPTSFLFLQQKTSFVRRWSPASVPRAAQLRSCPRTCT